MRTVICCAALVGATACGHDESPSKPSPPPSTIDEPIGEAEREAKQDDATPEGPGLAAKVDEAVDRAKASKSTLLIPAGVTIMAGVDIPAFIAKPYWRTIKDNLGSRPRRQLEASERCKVGPDKWRSFVIGVEPITQDMAMVVEATGIGKHETLLCLQKEFGRFTLSEDGKEMSDATGGGIVLDDDRIAFATPQFMQPLRDRIANKGQPAADAALESVLAKTDQGKALWFSAIIPPTQAAMAATALGGWPSDLTGELDLSDGVAVDVRLATSDPHAAKGKIEAQWETVARIARASGVPGSVVDSVTMTAGDGELTIKANAADDDITAALARLTAVGKPETAVP